MWVSAPPIRYSSGDSPLVAATARPPIEQNAILGVNWTVRARFEEPVLELAKFESFVCQRHLAAPLPTWPCS
jgi:hypothetical protein